MSALWTADMSGQVRSELDAIDAAAPLLTADLADQLRAQAAAEPSDYWGQLQLRGGSVAASCVVEPGEQLADGVWHGVAFVAARGEDGELATWRQAVTAVEDAPGAWLVSRIDPAPRLGATAGG